MNKDENPLVANVFFFSCFEVKVSDSLDNVQNENDVTQLVTDRQTEWRTAWIARKIHKVTKAFRMRDL